MTTLGIDDALLAPSRAPRNLVLCCDGTGNVWRPGPNKTNVVKLVECLAHDPARQVFFYDPGVGTPDGYISESGQSLRDLVRRVAGLVWGDGVWANVADAYAFLVANYRPGDRIFLFGFSRGAFTARAVAGVINLCGILRREHSNLIATLLQVYRMRPDPRDGPMAVAGVPDSRGRIGASIKATFALPDAATVHFIGVWETVESVGLRELALGAQISSDPTVKPAFVHVRHALALDELRRSYAPRLYTTPLALPPGHTFAQVWFAGDHGDVGGGYADAGLAHVALHWMAHEAMQQGLLLDQARLAQHTADAFGTLHNEVARFPTWTAAGTYRRTYPADMTLHPAVQARMQSTRMQYHVALPAGAQVVAAAATWAATSQDASRPPRDGVARWFWLWLVIALTACGWVVGRGWPQPALLPLLLSPAWHGTLGNALASAATAFGETLSRLLWREAFLLACLACLLPALTFLGLRAGDRNGAITAAAGRFLLWTMWLIPLAGLAANAFAQLCAGAAPSTSLALASSVLSAACSSVQLVAGIGWLAGILACLAHAPRR